jgi:hypothetical protein
MCNRQQPGDAQVQCVSRTDQKSWFRDNKPCLRCGELIASRIVGFDVDVVCAAVFVPVPRWSDAIPNDVLGKSPAQLSDLVRHVHWRSVS